METVFSEMLGELVLSWSIWQNIDHPERLRRDAHAHALVQQAYGVIETVSNTRVKISYFCHFRLHPADHLISITSVAVVVREHASGSAA